ncbi:receptor-like protein eix2 [Quercus suber]|uniref:Receptor-like protein eix2 n=1 Tax=Quercus suber TaxID=58331 RepID=A0AAW0K8H8_QUESU
MGVRLKLQKWWVNSAGFDDSPWTTHYQITELYDSKIDFKKGILRKKEKNLKREDKFNSKEDLLAQSVKCLKSDQDALINFKMVWKILRTGFYHGKEATVKLLLQYGFWNLSGEVRPSLVKLKSLRYLDLSFNTFNGIPIPIFFGSLENLQYRNLSNAGFSGKIPPNLGNLSSLEYLDVKLSTLTVDNLEWMAGLASLKHLMMNEVDLSMVGSDWVVTLNKLPPLIELHLSSCRLSGYIPSLDFVNFTSLAL